MSDENRNLPEAEANENAGSALPSLMEQPAPAAPVPPPVSAAAPVPEPPRPVRRVGTWTMGIALILLGVGICIFHFQKDTNLLLYLCRFSPLVLVALGCEVLVASATAKNARLKYDFLSMFVCLLLLAASLAASCIPMVIEYAGPARSFAETRVEQSLYDTLYGELKGKSSVSYVSVNVNLDYSGSYDAVQTADDLTAGDWVYMTVELSGDFADKAAFVHACRPVLDAVRAQHLPGVGLHFRTADLPDEYPVQYTLDVSGAYQLEMTDAQLAGYAGEQTYNEEAGYYMTPGEAAQWEREWSAAEYERRADELQQQLADARETIEILQAEAELAVDRAVDQANADAEASIAALREQIDILQAQLDAWNNG